MTTPGLERASGLFGIGQLCQKLGNLVILRHNAATASTSHTVTARRNLRKAVVIPILAADPVMNKEQPLRIVFRLYRLEPLVVRARVRLLLRFLEIVAF